MKRILITIDDDTYKVLEKSANRSETVRQALKVYQNDISTDTLAGIKQSFRIVVSHLAELEKRNIEMYEMLESVKSTLDELRQ